MKHIIPIAILVLCLCILPAAAVIQEVTVSGTVSEHSSRTIPSPS